MKWKTLAVVLLLALACIYVPAWTAYSQRTYAPPTWEYKVVDSSQTEYKGGIDFDKLGSQGWELVAVEQSLQNGNSSNPKFYFKRAK